MRLYRSYNKFLESTTSESDIIDICHRYDIVDYTINDDGSIDVDFDVILDESDLTELPLKFRKVNGGFYIRSSKLTTLKGAPEYVEDNFTCEDNNITTLEGCPKFVGGKFDCSYNYLTDLVGSPNHVGGDFICFHNSISSLEGSPKRINGFFECQNNKLTNLIGCPSARGFYFNDNNISNFSGFPEDIKSGEYTPFFFEGNPIQNILNLFPEEKWSDVAYWMNEYDVISGDKISIDRFEEVMNKLNLSFIKGYKIV
jgi:hypothetical protein